MYLKNHIEIPFEKKKFISCSIFYHEHVLTKEAGTSKATPWHHDQSYYPVDGNQIVSLWIPVDFVGMESAIRFVKGSHSWNKYGFQLMIRFFYL